MFDDAVVGGEDVPDRLEEFGLSTKILRESLVRGQRAFNEVTANHPTTASGWYRWSECNRANRDQLAPLGWTKDNRDNLPRVVSPDGRLAFYATSGNIDTGLAHRIPSTRRPRGSAGARDVADNAQRDLFLPTPLNVASRRETWLLLYHHLVGADEELIRSEFSLPAKVDKRGRIVRWTARIILPTIDLLNEPMTGRDDGSDGEIEITVTRKNA